MEGAKIFQEIPAGIRQPNRFVNNRVGVFVRSACLLSPAVLVARMIPVSGASQGMEDIVAAPAAARTVPAYEGCRMYVLAGRTSLASLVERSYAGSCSVTRTFASRSSDLLRPVYKSNSDRKIGAVVESNQVLN